MSDDEDLDYDDDDDYPYPDDDDDDILDDDDYALSGTSHDQNQNDIAQLLLEEVRKLSEPHCPRKGAQSHAVGPRTSKRNTCDISHFSLGSARRFSR